MLLPRSIATITEACGEDRSKLLLDVVHLERDKDGNALAVTTDGRRFLVAKWKDKASSEDYFEASGGEAKTQAKPDLEVNLPIKPFEEIFKAIPKKCKHPVLEHALLVETEIGTKVPLETREDDGTVRGVAPKPVEGNFPNWRDSLPEYDLLPSKEGSNEAVRVRVPAEQFASLMKAVWTTAGKAQCDYVDLIVPLNTLRPVEIRSNPDEGIKVTGFLTPIQAEDTKTPYAGALPAAPALKPPAPATT